MVLAAAASHAACAADDETDAPAPAPDDGGAPEAAADTGPADDAAPPPVCTQTPCITGLALGGTHACAVAADKNVWCWGSNLSGELGAGSLDDAGFDGGQPLTAAAVSGVAGATAVAAGGQGQTYDFSCAVLEDGNARCWGSDRYGQLGRGGDAGGPGALTHVPAPVASLSEIKAVRGGGAHACALLRSGGVSCWGFNALSQLGQPASTAQSNTPAPPSLPPGSQATDLAAGQFHTCALLGDTSVWCWGENAKGQLGRSVDGGAKQDPVAAPVVGLSTATQIAAGNFHSCARLASGMLLCWGQNDRGQIGRGPGGALIEPSPGLVALPAGSNAIEVTAGLLHTCALLSDSTVWCWGANATGAVGPNAIADGGGFDPSDVLTPRKVEDLPGKPIAIRAGYLHTCALLEGGSVACWGGNQFGELGRGVDADGGTTDTKPHSDPQLVKF